MRDSFLKYSSYGHQISNSQNQTGVIVVDRNNINWFRMIKNRQSSYLRLANNFKFLFETSEYCQLCICILFRTKMVNFPIEKSFSVFELEKSQLATVENSNVLDSIP